KRAARRVLPCSRGLIKPAVSEIHCRDLAKINFSTAASYAELKIVIRTSRKRNGNKKKCESGELVATSCCATIRSIAQQVASAAHRDETGLINPTDATRQQTNRIVLVNKVLEYLKFEYKRYLGAIMGRMVLCIEREVLGN
ncbi:MAG: hypothetical protein MHMPM18_004776, partial [Marteilia pararefringens]